MKNVEKILEEYKSETMKVSPKNRDENILKLLELSKKGHGDFRDFVSGQLSMFGKVSLVWELVWLVFFIAISFNCKKIFGTQDVLPLISILSPFLLIVFATDIGKVTNRSVLEIEATTKYSISQILLFRLLTVEVTQLVMVFIGAMIWYKTMGYSLPHLLLYGYTPLVFSSAVLLLCISRFRGKAIQYAGVSITVLIVALLGVFCTMSSFEGVRIDIFHPSNIWIWEIVLIASVVAFGLELILFRKGVKVNGIGTMRSIEML